MMDGFWLLVSGPGLPGKRQRVRRLLFVRVLSATTVWLVQD
jgi:hypothetical protein